MRIRSLKPGFFDNELLAEQEPLARLLFQGLWCLADRDGRLEDRPRRIKAKVLPYDNCDADELLYSLAEAMESDGRPAFIIRYKIADEGDVRGGHYIQIVNFTKHQKPHYKEIPSQIPAPPDWTPPVPDPDDDDDRPIIEQSSTNAQPTVANDRPTKSRNGSLLTVNRNQEWLTGDLTPPIPPQRGARKNLRVIGESTKSAALIDAVKSAGFDPQMRPQDHKALKDSPAPADLVARAYIACARGEWQQWIRDNSLNVQTITGRIASFQAWEKNRTNSRGMTGSRYTGSLSELQAIEEADQA